MEKKMETTIWGLGPRFRVLGLKRSGCKSSKVWV